MRLHATRSPSSDASSPADASRSSSPDAPDAALWSLWKRWFEAWEPGAARVAEQALRQSWVLEPAGFVLTSLMRAKVASDRVTEAWLGAFGLSSRTEQLRLRHEINTLSSRLLDLQERLEHGEGGAR